MAGKVILTETTLAFEYSSAFDAYAHVVDSLPFEFITGHQYTITWDGIEYVRTAFAFTATDGSSCISVGNPIAAGESSNGDPFAIVCETTNSYLYYVSTGSEDTHTVIISLNEGIVLKDRNGNDVAYYGIETVTFDTTTEGKQQTYTKGVKEDKTVALDMAAGDLVVEPDADKLFGKVTVTKPETLTPENVRNGVEIGGIVGTLIGDTEEQTLALAMADGDMVIEPSEEGKVLSRVTIQKPETMLPENIRSGVTIGDVIGDFTGDTEEKTVVLDMLDGDMTIEPSETGKSFSKVTIKKPDTLVPDNIAKGVDIAGVVGELGSDYNMFMKIWEAPSTLPSSLSFVEVASVEELEAAGLTVYSNSEATTNHLFTIMCAVNLKLPYVARTFGMIIGANVPGCYPYSSSDWTSYPPHNIVGLANYTFSNSTSVSSTKSPASAPCSLENGTYYGLNLSAENGLSFRCRDLSSATNPRGKYFVMVMQHKTMTASQLYSS